MLTANHLQTGQYGNDIEMDYIADAAADAYADWRNTWSASNKASQVEIAKYRETRSKFYTTQEWYYGQKSDSASPYLLGGALWAPFTLPSVGELALFDMH
jgi:hypothetical protein